MWALTAIVLLFPDVFSTAVPFPRGKSNCATTTFNQVYIFAPPFREQLRHHVALLAIWSCLLRTPKIIFPSIQAPYHLILLQHCPQFQAQPQPRLFGPVYLDPYIWTRLFGHMCLYLSVCTCLFGPIYLDPSIWTHLFGDV